MKPLQLCLPLFSALALAACQPPGVQRRDLDSLERSLSKIEERLGAIEKSLAAQPPAAAQPAEGAEGATPKPEAAREITVYVMGGVKSAGRYQLPQGATAYAAIATAGGFAEFAKKDLTITRAGEPDIPLGPLEQKDFVLENGDVLMINLSAF